jgi:hypothetical protein
MSAIVSVIIAVYHSTIVSSASTPTSRICPRRTLEIHVRADAKLNYQLALIIPGISPLRLNDRKQMRHIWNLRRYPRTLPHTGHRLYSLTLNFFGRLAFTINAVRATDSSFLFQIEDSNHRSFSTAGESIPQSFRNGTPRCLSNACPSASVRAVVEMVISIP